ncbi:acyltransferase [Rhodococcus sp. SRB_17]|uniref:acyltransferase family protein n=1 Tax=Acidovorax sp. SRB_24 TaxID=1962700 RepID=UPI00197BC02D|nr:acyltransferase [Acidovorax sp. SRB_24]NMM77418.1 acyltransferase [Acidovorax sp. SRB_24]NMM87070.1 acyltransferase [Rhodococcus sp. SRB_17]
MHPSASRNPLIDAFKGLACAAIVWHHLAFYGPMSDIAQPLWPGAVAWLYDYGRMAVQVFLVLGGYLAAASLAPLGVARFDSASVLVTRRFVRLVVPYAAALVLAVLAAALVRPWLDDASVPGEPSLPQLLANALLLQDIVGEEALSAGAWYVAIDFQLFALTCLLFAAVRSVPGLAPRRRVRWAQALVVLATAASLWGFNRDSGLDMWGVYFFGSYGLGVLAFWAVRAPRATRWLAVMAVLGALALALDFRLRIAVAWAVALGLVGVMRSPAVPAWPGMAALQRLGQMSYSVFLVHFPVCLVVNAVVGQLWPQSPTWNAAGMLLAFGLSLVAGRQLYEQVERRVPSWTLALRWQAGLVGTGVLVALADNFP